MSEPPSKKLKRSPLDEIPSNVFYSSIKKDEPAEDIIPSPVKSPPSSSEVEGRRRQMIALKEKDRNGVLNMCKIFKKQKDAFRYLEVVLENMTNGDMLAFQNENHHSDMIKLCKDELFIFSFQFNPQMMNEQFFKKYAADVFEGFKQERYFMLSSITFFTQFYFQLHPDVRHFYEIIQEDRPCYLYFDIEADLKKNPKFDKENCVPTILKELKLFLSKEEKIFDRPITFEPEDVLDLDSTKSEKYSRHLIIKLRTCSEDKTECAFQDNFDHMNRFVKIFINHHLRPLRSTDPLIDALFVSNLDIIDESLHEDEEVIIERNTCVIDQGVYTRNRAFRCMLSKKLNSDVMLNVAVCNKLPFVDQKDCFLKSLISNVHQDTIALSISKDNVRAESPSTKKPVRFSFSSFDAYNPDEVLTQKDLDLLKEFILTVIDNKGFVRSHQYNPSKQTIIYQIGGNRYCGNIGREHKSNHVMYLIDLQRGGGIYFQKWYV
ncbi:DNA-directed primase/polymerase [Acrasis kona]|uniref:DNA-directed primase/polymerase protein n=1 Tax=Acrasis kona TaxID=1008807 RepID=A0AAW2YS93_9EUKA